MVKVEDHKSVGRDSQKDARPMSGRKPAYESRATEFRRRLIAWRQAPESLKPSLRALARELDTSHQLLAHYLNGLDRWQAEEEAKRIRARAKAEGRPMTLRGCYSAILLPGLLGQIEELRHEAKRGPLNRHQVQILKLFARQFPQAQEILQKCRQMTPEEEKQARAFERKAMFTSAALKNIERIKQAAERGPQKDDISVCAWRTDLGLLLRRGFIKIYRRRVPRLPHSGMLTIPPSGRSSSKQYGSFNLAKMQTWLRVAKISQ